VVVKGAARGVGFPGDRRISCSGLPLAIEEYRATVHQGEQLAITMGSTASVEAKAVLNIVMTLASKHEVPLKEKDVANLLLWGQRRNIFPSVEEVFDDRCWNALERDLWESVTVGNRDAVRLSQIWRLVSQLLKDTKIESKVMQVVKQALSLEPPSITALPVDARDFFGNTVPPAPLLEEGYEDMEMLTDPKHVPLLGESEILPSAPVMEGVGEHMAQSDEGTLNRLLQENADQRQQLTQLTGTLKETMREQGQVLKNLLVQYNTEGRLGLGHNEKEEQRTVLVQTIDPGQ